MLGELVTQPVDIAGVSDDLCLVERVQKGDTAAFEELVHRYHRSVYNLALRLTDNPEDASDIAQETFLRVYRNMHTFRGDAELKTWIYRITVNQSSNLLRWWRRRFRHKSITIDTEYDGRVSERLMSSLETPEQATLNTEKRRMIQEALSRIKFDFRVAVILRDIEGLSYEEIGQALGLSVGTVKSRISRGREELREQLKKF